MEWQYNIFVVVYKNINDTIHLKRDTKQIMKVLRYV